MCPEVLVSEPNGRSHLTLLSLLLLLPPMLEWQQQQLLLPLPLLQLLQPMFVGGCILHSMHFLHIAIFCEVVHLAKPCSTRLLIDWHNCISKESIDEGRLTHVQVTGNEDLG